MARSMIWAVAGKHALQVVVAARRRNEGRPAVILREDRGQIGPRRGVRQRPFRGRQSYRRRTHQRIVIVGPTTCHVEPFMKRMSISVSRVFAPTSCGNASSMRRRPRPRIYRVPYGFAGLRIFRQHVPVRADAIERTDRMHAQVDIVLARAAMPDEKLAVAPVKPRYPCRPLIIARLPFMWKVYARHAVPR